MVEEPTKILLIEDNPADARLIREMLSEMQGTPVELSWSDRLASGLKQLAQGNVDIVLLDLSLPDSWGFETFTKVRARAPGLPVIVVTSQEDQQVALRAAREGAQDYVVKGSVNSQSLAHCIRFAMARHKAVAASSPEGRVRESGRVLGFIGAKGGTGTTTVALSVAAVLAQSDKSVIALELRSYFGAFSQQFRRRPGCNLSDLLDLDAREIDDKALQKRLMSLPCGVKAMFGPQTAGEYKEIQPQQAEAIVRAAARMADYVIVDLPPHPCPASQAAVARCGFTALVVEREPVSLAAGKVMAELLRGWIMDQSAFGAVLAVRNPATSFQTLPDIEAQLGCQIVGVVPPAAELCAAALRIGAPLALVKRDSLAAAGLAELAHRLAQPVPAAVPL